MAGARRYFCPFALIHDIGSKILIDPTLCGRALCNSSQFLIRQAIVVRQFSISGGFEWVEGQLCKVSWRTCSTEALTASSLSCWSIFFSSIHFENMLANPAASALLHFAGFRIKRRDLGRQLHNAPFFSTAGNNRLRGPHRGGFDANFHADRKREGVQ